MEKALLFTNYSQEDFSHTWDSVKYDFPKGQSMMLESALAHHFARHLAIRELNKKGEITSSAKIKEELTKALGTTTVEATDKTQLEQETMNYNREELLQKAEEKGIKVDQRKTDENLAKELEAFEGA